jgi:hypothetical protein
LTVVILIHPEVQRCKDCVCCGDETVVVASVDPFVELRKRQEAVSFYGGWLWSEVAKKLLPVVDLSVVVSIECQPSVIRSMIRPSHEIIAPVTASVEIDAALGIGKREAVAF